MTAALVTLWRLNSWAQMRYSFHKLLFSLTIEPGPLLGCGVGRETQVPPLRTIRSF